MLDVFNFYGETKIKPYLKMSVQRIQIANNKRTNAVKIQKQKIATLLAEGKDEKARIQVEHIIRDDFTIEGYEVLELMCELVHERIRQITTSKTCPQDLKEAVCSLIWASKNVDIEELKNVCQQLKQKYGGDFCNKAVANEEGEVNARLYAKLVYKPPSAVLVIKYLEEIAKAYNVDWTPSSTGMEDGEVPSDKPFATPKGDSIPMAPGTGFTAAYAPTLITAQPGEKLKYPALSKEEEVEYQQSLKLQDHQSFARPAGVMPSPSQSSSQGGGGFMGAPAIASPPPPAARPISLVVHATAVTEDDLVVDEERNGSSNDDNGNGGDALARKLQAHLHAATAPVVTGKAASAPPSSSSSSVTYAAPTAPPSATAPPAATVSSPAPAAPATIPEDPLAALQARLAALNKNNS